MRQSAKWMVLVSVIPSVMAATPAFAEKVKGLPVVTDDDYQANPVLALKGGVNLADGLDGEIGQQVGAELAIDCPLLSLPGGQIRQQVSYNYARSAALDIHTVEFNPHYMVSLTKKFAIGAGPGFGYTYDTDDAGGNHHLGLNLGGGVHVYVKRLFLGLESRYQFTVSDPVDTWSSTAKIGVVL